MANDPNKYSKNKDIKPDTLVQTMISVGSMLLMFIGIIGIATDFFREDSMAKKALGWLFDSTAHMIFIPVIIGVLWLADRIFSSATKGETKKSGNIPMYIMMAIGAYYVFHFLAP